MVGAGAMEKEGSAGIEGISVGDLKRQAAVRAALGGKFINPLESSQAWDASSGEGVLVKGYQKM